VEKQARWERRKPVEHQLRSVGAQSSYINQLRKDEIVTIIPRWSLKKQPQGNKSDWKKKGERKCILAIQPLPNRKRLRGKGKEFKKAKISS